MAVSEEEKKTARAYNAGYILASYEPRLLEKMIAANKNNEFVKVMNVAKEHHDFNRGIPKTNQSREYKNGFHNARSIGQDDPKLLDQLIGTKTLHKDYISGLAAGKKEYEVVQTMNRMKQERVNKTKGIERNSEEEKLYIKGFNYGYRTASQNPELLSDILHTDKDYNLFIDGIVAGQEEFGKGKPNTKQLSQEQLKELDYQKGFNQGYLLSKHDPKLTEDLSRITIKSQQILGLQDGIAQQQKEVEKDLSKDSLPSWLKDDPFAKDGPAPEPEKDIDIEPEV